MTHLPHPHTDDVEKLRPLTEAERQQLLVAWNATQADFPHLCVHQLFEQQAAETPDAIALLNGAQHLTYRELNGRANQLAHYLQTLGVKPDDLVGICMPRSAELLVGLLGIFKAGGAYVPFDVEYPPERLSYMLQDSAARVLLTLTTQLPQLAPLVAATAHCQIVCVDHQCEHIAQEAVENPVSGVQPNHLAYCIYTSGSTGNPKGVAMEHRALANLIWWHRQTRAPVCGVKTLQFCAVSFDFSFHEIFSSLCLGGMLVVVTEAVRRNPFALAQFIASQGIEKLFLPVTALAQLAEATEGGPVPTMLREVITTGELLQITPAMVNLFRQTSALLHNHYGATEFQDGATLTLQGDPDAWPTLVPVGRPLHNVQVYILDEQGEPVPVGMAGELCIGGVGVARGYLYRSPLTQEKFIPDPFASGDPRARLYRTGDLARYRPDGVIEHLGRMDQQVKIRGFRVEVGEIEAALNQQPTVGECAVVARDDVAGNKQLVAYIVPTPHATALLEMELRSALACQLPEYMLPAAFVLLEAMPLTPSGKLDRRALPSPTWSRPTLDTALVLPQSTMEQRLAELWRAILHVDIVGIHDNFFEVGGTSLLLVQVHKKLLELLVEHSQVELSPMVLFQYPTIHSLAQHLSQQIKAGQAPQASLATRPDRVATNHRQAVWAQQRQIRQQHRRERP